MLKLKKIGKKVFVVASIDKEAFEALSYGNSVLTDENGKVVFVLSQGKPSINDYSVTVDNRICVVSEIETEDVEELKMHFAEINANLTACEKNAKKVLAELKKSAAKIEVEEEGAEENA